MGLKLTVISNDCQAAEDEQHRIYNAFPSTERCFVIPEAAGIYGGEVALLLFVR